MSTEMVGCALPPIRIGSAIAWSIPRERHTSHWEDMPTKLPKIDAVFCENDSMCQGAQKAIHDAGRSNEIFLTSVDVRRAL
jgi:ABC-type sugar transport system substrate-binding protein